MGLERDMADGWIKAIGNAELERRGRAVVRVAGKQLALFVSSAGVFACNNRCPHEGYPLSEGSLDDECRLTCNWHNWKFDLKTGASLYGGDRVRVYPTELRNGDIWVDTTDPAPEARRGEIIGNLRDAFDDNDFTRMARETARLLSAGGDPVAAAAEAVGWSHDRLEFGMTHAYVGAADWLALHDRQVDDPELRLVCLLEAIGHMPAA